jgi:hypothetical protein
MFGRPRIEPVKLHHIGKVNRAFALDDRALGMLLALARVPLDHLQAFDDDAPASSDNTAMILPRLPFSLPASTTTSSPFFT